MNAQATRIDRGKSVCKAKRLHKLRSIRRFSQDGNLHRVAADDNEICEVAAATFGERWGTSNLQARESALDFICSSERQLPDLQTVDFVIAFQKLKRWEKLDIDGICVLLLWICFSCKPDDFICWMRRCLAHRSSIEALRARCAALGKKCPDSLDTDLRAVVPMAAILRLLDRVLAIRLEAHINELLPCLPGFFVGAQRHTQCLDIAHGAALVIEKGLDSHSEGSFAQADLRQYFDSLHILKILLWLVMQGVDRALVAAIGRHQLLSTIWVYSGQCSSRVGNRSSGGLTGSTLAFLLARIPVESTFAELDDALSASSLKLEVGSLKAAAYVDNLYTASRHASGATSQMEILLAHLRDVWGLHVKADSKRILTVKGAGDDILVGTHWIAEDVSDALGWPIQADGGHSACWSRMLAKMWASFYSNVKARGWRKLGMRRRLALLQRCVAPIVAHYAAIIPPQHAYGVKIDRVQRRMVSAAMANTRLAIESWVTFVRRSARQSALWIEQNSFWWSRRWFERSVKWADHLERDANQQRVHYIDGVSLCLLSTRCSWAAAMYSHQNSAWLAEKRVFFRRTAWSESLISRTGTRAVRGRVHTRFQEGVEHARRML